MKHTKEPWKIASDLPVYGIYSESEDRHIVQTINQNNYKTHGKSKENTGIQNYIDAERIVSCVNACAGITNEALENGVIKEAMELFWIVSDKAILNENNQMTYKGGIVFASDKEEDV